MHDSRELERFKREAPPLTLKPSPARKPGVAGAMPAAEPAAPTFGFHGKAKKDVDQAAARTIVQIADKTFYRKADGFLVDSLYDEAKHKEKTVEVKAFSDEYFELLKKHPGIGRYLAEGKPMVLVVDDDHVYKITKAD